MKNKKIAFVCIYSHPSICGVWSRVYNLSKMLIKKGHEVHIFSTNIIKGTDKKSDSCEDYEKIHVHRFDPKLSFGENVKFWNFSNEIKKVNPDIIIAEVYRHPHTRLALKIAKKLKKPCYLVTHAPFVESELRNSFDNFLVRFYDRFYGKKNINKFDKIISITKWEIPYLLKLGIDKKKIIYIPNGIPEEFFIKRQVVGKDILFLGRIAPIKNLETLIKSIKLVSKKYTNIKLKIIGPSEVGYEKRLKNLVENLDLQKNIEFLPAVYDVNEKISLIDKSLIFVLPSKREAMPQSLIEAMSRGKLVIASKNKGSKEIITDKENGFLFDTYSEHELAKIINSCLDNGNEKVLLKVMKNALNSSKKFNWRKIFNDFYKLLIQ